MFIFAVSCFAGAIFIIIYVPETKNKSIEEIQEIMAKWMLAAFPEPIEIIIKLNGYDLIS